MQQLAKAATLTYPDNFVSDLNQFASLGAHGNSEQNCQRDLLQKLPQLLAPEPYLVEVPLIVLQDNKKEMVLKDIPVLLPHEWFASMLETDLIDFICGGTKVESFWSQTPLDDPRLFENPMMDIEDWHSKVVPFLLHADAAPHQNKDTINILSFRSILSNLGISESQLMIAALPESCRATTKTCTALGLMDFDGDTWDNIWDAVVWSFNQLLLGRWPDQDHKGKPFPAGSKRALKAGSKLGQGVDLLGIVWIITGDLKHLSVEWGLASHSSLTPCFKCACNKSTIPFNDFRQNAKWKQTIFTPEYYKLCPPTEHKLMDILGVSGFTFFYDPMHCLEIGVAGHTIANVLFDIFHFELHGVKAERLQKLFNLIRDGYDQLGITSGRISRLELSYFSTPSAPFKNFPDIMHSAIKARQCRYLAPVALKLCKDYHNEANQYSKHRLACLENLNIMYDLVDPHPVFLPASQQTLYAAAVEKFLLQYSACARIAQNLGKLQWSVVPKHHCVAHFPAQSKMQSPRAFWAYGGEHMVGDIAELAASCLNGTPAHLMPSTLVLKYRVAMHLFFETAVPS